jgi:hypothetical protein
MEKLGIEPHQLIDEAYVDLLARLSADSRPQLDSRPSVD